MGTAARQVAIIGSSSGLKESEPLAERLGKALGKRGFVVLVGAGEGLPMVAAAAAKAAGGRIIGMSPELNASEHGKLYPSHSEDFDAMIYTGFELKGRNLILVRSAEAVIMVGGSIGTANEFTIAFDEGKIIGVLEGSGGASDMARDLAHLGKHKNTGVEIAYSKDPEELVERVSRLLELRSYN